MPRIKHISISKPCHEDWRQMAPTDKGRYCQSCCKTVVDFTNMSNAEVIAYLSSNKNTCGRITGSKMASVNNQLQLERRKRFSWKGLIAAASLSMILPAIHAKARSQPKTEQALAQPRLFLPAEAAPVDSVDHITITGVVKAKEDGLPLPGVTVMAKGTSIVTITSRDGSFTLKVPKKTKRIVVSFIGYYLKEIKLKNIEGSQNVVLNPVLEAAYSGGIDVF